MISFLFKGPCTKDVKRGVCCLRRPFLAGRSILSLRDPLFGAIVMREASNSKQVSGTRPEMHCNQAIHGVKNNMAVSHVLFLDFL